MIDIHVHNRLPFLGGAVGAAFHNFSLKPGKEGGNVFGVAFYEPPFPLRKSARRSLFARIGEFREKRGGNIIYNADDLDNFISSRSKAGASAPAFILGVESLRPVAALEDIEKLMGQGVRFLQPAHFLDNRFARSYRMGIFRPSSKGLTALGLELLTEMERLGLIIDITHMNVAGMNDVLKQFTGPITCSHTGLQDVRDTIRNIPGDIAAEIFKRGGLVGVTPWKWLLEKFRPTGLRLWNLAFCKTVIAFLDLGGRKGVAIGSDRGAPLNINREFFQKKI